MSAPPLPTVLEQWRVRLERDLASYRRNFKPEGAGAQQVFECWVIRQLALFLAVAGAPDGN